MKFISDTLGNFTSVHVKRDPLYRIYSVIVISKLLKDHSKAKRRAPAYSRAQRADAAVDNTIKILNIVGRVSCRPICTVYTQR